MMHLSILPEKLRQKGDRHSSQQAILCLGQILLLLVFTLITIPLLSSQASAALTIAETRTLQPTLVHADPWVEINTTAFSWDQTSLSWTFTVQPIANASPLTDGWVNLTDTRCQAGASGIRGISIASSRGRASPQACRAALALDLSSAHEFTVQANYSSLDRVRLEAEAGNGSAITAVASASRLNISNGLYDMSLRTGAGDCTAFTSAYPFVRADYAGDGTWTNALLIPVAETLKVDPALYGIGWAGDATAHDLDALTSHGVYTGIPAGFCAYKYGQNASTTQTFLWSWNNTPPKCDIERVDGTNASGQIGIRGQWDIKEWSAGTTNFTWGLSDPGPGWSTAMAIHNLTETNQLTLAATVGTAKKMNNLYAFLAPNSSNWASAWLNDSIPASEGYLRAAYLIQYNSSQIAGDAYYVTNSSAANATSQEWCAYWYSNASSTNASRCTVDKARGWPVVMLDKTAQQNAFVTISNQQPSTGSGGSPPLGGNEEPSNASVTNYTYDSNGNRLSDGALWFEYNEFNQLARVRNSSATGPIVEEYLYDESGQRLMKFEPSTGQRTLYFGDNLVRVINSSGTFDTFYYYADDTLLARRDPSNQTLYYHPDHLGSTSLVTNSTGAVAEVTTYEPFGRLYDQGLSRFLYTGKELDRATGLDYYGARYYDPDLGFKPRRSTREVHKV